MKKYILKKDHLIPFLRKLSRGARLVAPVRTMQGDVLYQEIETLDGIEIDLSVQPQESAKAFLLPQQERLFTYSDGKNCSFVPEEPGIPTVLFGLRSCDLSAILYMDVIFLRSPRDDFYLKRRSQTVLIGIGCNEPWENCFCNATNTGPFLEFGFDLQLTDLGNCFMVESGRARGDAILDEWVRFFAPVTPEDEKLRYQVVLEARAGFRRQVHVETACRRLQEGRVRPQVWRQFAQRCDGCGGCAYICPACTCFTIFDRRLGQGGGERIRAWDACTHEGFTRMAGGFNPVNMRVDRLRRRFTHKLLHDYTQFRRPGCMGCGRCVDICFGGVDIVKFIEQVCSDHQGQAPRPALGELLVEAGLIRQADLEEALERRASTGMPLGRVLMEMGLVTSDRIAACLLEKLEGVSGGDQDEG